MTRGAGEGAKGLRARWCGGGALACLLLLGACRDPALASGTALYVTTEFDASLHLTQLRVWSSLEGGYSLGPQLLPEQPGRLLHGGETLRLLLPDVPDGTPARVGIEGLSRHVTVARGESTARVRSGYEVDVTVQLLPLSGGGPADGGTPGAPDGGGTCTGCEGCCLAGACIDSGLSTCGTGGATCTACDPRRANACDARGRCVCGVGPACNSFDVDRCEGGQCRCGSSGPCPPGQACVGGACLCTPGACTGCCEGNTCYPGNHPARCGTEGESCQRCKKGCNPNGVCT